ncbi:MAG: alkaline phosphatase [Candidatus Alcyoniella australis]|nr:alkaline phosphatase [Candidatus Alcyoniella australis]
MRRAMIATIMAALLLFAACQRVEPTAPAPVPVPVPTPVPTPEPPRGADSIVLLIVDGMGPEALTLLDAYLLATDSGPNRFAELYDQGVLGLVTTYGTNNVTSDSASSATALSSGIKTDPGKLGMDPQGRCTTTIVDAAKRRGWATGLISTTRVTHSTPAAFASCLATHLDEPAVADQLLERGVDVLLGGGINAWIPAQSKASDFAPINAALDSPSKRKDENNRLDRAAELSYQVVFTKSQLESLGALPEGKLLGLFSGSVFPPSVDRLAEDAEYDLPTLEGLTRAALDVLGRDPDGFFLMVESAQVDYAAHANDPGWYLSEMLEANRTLGLLQGYLEQHPRTLLIVTADHATGGPALTYRAGTAAEGEGYTTFDEVCQKTVNVEETFVWPTFHDVRALGWQQHSYNWLIDRAMLGDNDPATLISLVEQHTSYKLDFQAATRVLAFADRNNDQCFELDCGYRQYYYPYIDTRRSAQLATELGLQTNLVWATGAHSHAPVTVGAVGPGSQHLAGWMDNTEIFLAMKAAMQ